MFNREDNASWQDQCKKLEFLVKKEKEFSSLREAEDELLSKIAKGMVLESRYRQPIRARLVSFLCTHPAAAKCIHPRGIRVKGQAIEGILALEHLTIGFPLEFTECKFPNGVKMADSRTQSLDFSKSTCESFEADRLEVRGNLLMESPKLRILSNSAEQQ